MLHQSKIEEGIKEIQELEKAFREAQKMEMLPLSFFSSSIDKINRLKTVIYELEVRQLHVMEEHLKKQENDRSEAPETRILADAIGQKVNTDFGKSFNLNDRFMAQRDSLQGNTNDKNG